MQCIISHSVVCIGRLEGRTSPDTPWTDLYTARYQNCYRGSERTNFHAEQFLLEDKQLSAAIADPDMIAAYAADGAERRVSLYLTYQPCHFSGGHVKTIGKAVTTSCTNRLLKWAMTELAPHGVSMEVVLAKIYRAHWEDLHKTEDERQVRVQLIGHARNNM